MSELIAAVLSAPMATLLTVAGLFFVGIAVMGKISGKVEPDRHGRVASGVIGVILLGTGFAVYMGAFQPPPATLVPTTAPSTTPAPATPLTDTPVPPTTPPPTTAPTGIPVPPTDTSEPPTATLTPSPATDDCFPNLPSPQILYSRKESIEGSARDRHWIGISNWADYPDELFASAPDLPPCGSNQNASRTWVQVHDATDDSRIYGYCAWSEMSSELWFAAAEGEYESVYIVLTDRRCNVKYTSNSIVVP